MKSFFTVLFVFAVLYSSAYAQTDHKWKPLVVNDIKKVWVDEVSLESVKGDKFEVWLLQMHVPPLKMDGIKGEVYRAKTLYAVDLAVVKYGIEQVIYYDADNNEIYRHNYKITDYEDNLKYTYPVMEKSSIHMVIQELYAHRAEKKN
ncbi:MAG: hypothetical protein R6W90_10705 [Ignavibacteriaceae bacterium]